jgi:hypothetical protein
VYRFYLWIKEGDEGEGPEGLRYEDICDLPEPGEVLLEVLTRHLLRAPAHEHLARHLLHLNTEQRYKAELCNGLRTPCTEPAAPEHRAGIYKADLCTGPRTPCRAPAAPEYRAGMGCAPAHEHLARHLLHLNTQQSFAHEPGRSLQTDANPSYTNIREVIVLDPDVTGPEIYGSQSGIINFPSKNSYLTFDDKNICDLTLKDVKN